MPEHEAVCVGAAGIALRQPPYSITPDMLLRVVQIGEAIGRAEAASVSQDSRLRRINQEVRNAIKTFDTYERWNPSSETALLNAHEILMAALAGCAGPHSEIPPDSLGRQVQVGSAVR